MSERRTILLVEDDPDDVLLIQRAFRKLGGQPVPLSLVGDGEQAVAYLQGEGAYADRASHPLPDLLLLDLKLPRRSGFEVLEWLRAQPGLRRLPVVVLTGSQVMTDVDRAFDLGANSYLVKPVGFDALLEIVRLLDLYWLTYNEKPNLTPPS